MTKTPVNAALTCVETHVVWTQHRRRGHATDEGHKLGELEDQIKGLERRTDELRAERDAANALIGRMRESIETAQSMVESFVYSFDMQERADGVLEWSEDCWEDKYYELLSDWNKFVPQYNAVVAPRLRNFGRPLLASDASATMYSSATRPGNRCGR